MRRQRAGDRPASYRPYGVKVPSKREPTTLTADTLKLLHEQLADFYADSEEPVGEGVRDAGLLDSAAHRPLTALGETYKYPDPYSAAAALGHSIVHSHPFNDGNKRSALLAMIAVLDRQDIGLSVKNAHAFEFMLRVAQHQLVQQGVDSRPDPDLEVSEMGRWLRANTRTTPHQERRLVYRELEKALRGFDVESSHPGVANRVDFTRRLEDGRVLKSQITWNGRGTSTVEPATVRKVRQDLQLDDLSGVDHKRFYEAAPPLNALLLSMRGALDALAEYDRTGLAPSNILEPD